MTIKLLDRLYNSGDLRNLLVHGMISPNVLLWRKIYHCYEGRRDKGFGVVESYEDAASVFSVSARTVSRIVKKMEYDPG